MVGGLGAGQGENKNGVKDTSKSKCLLDFL